MGRRGVVIDGDHPPCREMFPAPVCTQANWSLEACPHAREGYRVMLSCPGWLSVRALPGPRCIELGREVGALLPQLRGSRVSAPERGAQTLLGVALAPKFYLEVGPCCPWQVWGHPMPAHP